MKLLDAARGDGSADFVVRNARVANVYTMEYENADVAVVGNRIAGVGKDYRGSAVVDAEGMILIPGMIDGHVHIESTMLTPAVFADCVAPRGTTTVMADPHEIANVLGMDGVEYMYSASRGLPVDVFLGAPSCVPASELETSFEDLEMDSVREMFERGWCQHLGEVMNFPAVIAGDPSVWGKIQAAGSVPLTGHAPGLSGKALCAYLISGVSSDHECVSPEEALEKLRRGMWLMMREGASSPVLARLLPLLRDKPELASRCMAVSDDVTAKYLMRVGHMDAKVRVMVREGIDPLAALRMVTLSPAEYFGLKDRGAVAPGLRADMALVDGLETFRIDRVWKNGRLTADKGKICRTSACPADPKLFRRRESPYTPLTADQLEVKIPRGAGVRVIKLNEGSLVTNSIIERDFPARDGTAVPDAGRDLSKIVVQERHRDTRRFGVGFVSGLGLKSGAIASSVAHDAHNFVAAGMDDLSIVTALAFLGENGGGLAVTCGGDVLGSLALPVAGLMSTMDAESVARALEDVERTARDMGVSVAHPFMALSFLCLSVIPELKITDRGYADIGKGGIQPLFYFPGVESG
ncbi:MAG: adenine deaminase [Synergistaceae bacterium]|jgi:adenine deaminase|nr:adenine deaminase [Synergistaceae bacterium]